MTLGPYTLHLARVTAPERIAARRRVPRPMLAGGLALVAAFLSVVTLVQAAPRSQAFELVELAPAHLEYLLPPPSPPPPAVPQWRRKVRARGCTRLPHFAWMPPSLHTRCMTAKLARRMHPLQVTTYDEKFIAEQCAGVGWSVLDDVVYAKPRSGSSGPRRSQLSSGYEASDSITWME
jgi:hypothetical protein